MIGFFTAIPFLLIIVCFFLVLKASSRARICFFLSVIPSLVLISMHLNSIMHMKSSVGGPMALMFFPVSGSAIFIATFAVVWSGTILLLAIPGSRRLFSAEKPRTQQSVVASLVLLFVVVLLVLKEKDNRLQEIRNEVLNKAATESSSANLKQQLTDAVAREEMDTLSK